jgi:hypothetical protein
MHNGCVILWFSGTARVRASEGILKGSWTTDVGRANWLKYSYRSPAVIERES